MKVLVAGWFSFEQMGATAGDLLTRDLACQWLRAHGRSFDIAVAPPFTEGVDWQRADPAQYSHVLFVCGPLGNGWPVTGLFERFAGKPFVGLNLTMLDSLTEWNPFDLLLERDSSRAARPDLAFLADQPKVPTAGLILIHPQPEYGDRDRHQDANAALRQLNANNEAATVTIDTRLDENSTGLRTSAEIETLIARMDIVLTSRLHGMVLALKNGVPAVVVDPVAGGAKITRQASIIGWPQVFLADETSPEALQRAYEFCLTEAGRHAAREVGRKAAAQLGEVHQTFMDYFAHRNGEPKT